jgi:MraZ protein
MSFYGTNKHSIDQKGRIILPAAFRAKLGKVFMIAKWLDECLCIFSEEEWSRITEKVQNAPSTDSEVRTFSRVFFSGAAELEPDKQGRVLLPPDLRAYAGLKKEVCVVGTGTKIEIWDKVKWDEFEQKEGSDMTSTAEALSRLGI